MIRLLTKTRKSEWLTWGKRASPLSLRCTQTLFVALYCGSECSCLLWAQTKDTAPILGAFGKAFGLDATHKTNKEEKQLYTVVTMADSNKIAPAAMILVCDDTQDNLVAGLFGLVEIVGDCWRPLVCMVDDDWKGTNAKL